MKSLLAPYYGKQVTEGKILEWLKKEGEKFAIQEPVFLMETEKAVLEVRAPQAGKLVKILTPEGSTTKAGDPVALYEPEAEVGPEVLPKPGDFFKSSSV